MIESIIGLLFALLVLFLVFYIVKIAAGWFGAPEPVVHIVGLILLLIFLLWVFRAFSSGRWGF